MFIVDSVPELKDLNDVALLAKEIHKLKCKPRLIAIDTLNNAMVELDDNSASDYSLVTRAANYLRKQFDCAILFVDHVQRSDAAAMRGTGAKRHNSDVVFCSEGKWHALKITCTKWKGGAKVPPFHLLGSLVNTGRKDHVGRTVTAPVLTFNANPKAQGVDGTNGKEQHYRMSKVIPALRLASKNDLLPIRIKNLAELITGPPPKDAKEYATWEANTDATEKRLRRGVFGGRSGKRTTSKPGYLSDLAHRDNEGEPFDPLRFVLPEHYRIAPGIGPMPSDHDDLGD